MKQQLYLFIPLFLFLFIDSSVIGQVIFEDDFEFGTLKSEWTAKPNEEGEDGIVEVFANSTRSGVGHNSTFGVALGKSANGGFTTNALDLNLDLSSNKIPSGQIELTFWFSNNYDDTNPQDGIYFSDNGGTTFEKVYDFKPSNWCTRSYGFFPPIDVDELATNAGLSLTSQFVIRFQQHGENRFSTGGGFFFDDVSVYEDQTTFVKLPLYDDFEQPLGNMWQQGNPINTTNNPDFIRPSGRVLRVPNSEISYVENSGQFGMALYKECNDGFHTNALDLHVDLSSSSAPSGQIELHFWMSNNYDETNPQDGIYFSNDGGNSFEKVYDFRLSEWCVRTYGALPPIDVDELALKAGLSLTNQFVIRFQQHGESKLSTGDGILIDDVSIYEEPDRYSPIPFSDDFEQPLGDMWRQGDPLKSISDPSFVKLSGKVSRVSSSEISYAENSGQFGMALYKECNDGFGTNTLDLYLDLSQGITASDAIRFSFWLSDNYDETNPEDGIYLSDNAGQSFVKAFDFLPSDWDNRTYQQFNLDLADLIKNLNLAYSSTFIIRFQQHGESKLSTGDGFLIDDVEICVNNNCNPAPPSNINVSISTNAATCNQNNGSVTGTATGGSTPYTYNWSNGQTGATINNLSAGNYTLTVTDNTGATTIENATVVNNGEAPTADFTFTQNNGVVTFQTNSTSGCSWDFGDSNQSSNCNASNTYTQNGVYTVVLTVTNACESTMQSKDVTIDNNETPTNCESLSVGIATRPVNDCVRSFKAVPSGGTPPYSFLWRDGQTTDSIAYDVSVNPDYAYTVTDSEGCTFSAENTDTCTHTTNPPGTSNKVMLYAGEVQGNVGEQVRLPIIVENLDTLTVLEGQVTFDNPSIGQIMGAEAGAIDPGTINPNNLRIGFFATNGVGVALQPKDTLFYLVVELTGSPDDRSIVTLPDFDIYSSFTNNFMPLSYDTQNGTITIIGNFDITGTIQTYDNRGIAKATVEAQITLPDGSQDAKTVVATDDGVYSVQKIPAGSTVRLQPQKNTDIKNGLSTAALFLGQRYILGLPSPQISSPFQLFAGDVNCDNQFSTLDLVLTQKVLIEIDDSFADCEGTWDFTPEAERTLFRMSAGYHSGTAANQATVTPSGDTVVDFIGVKKGDLLNLSDPFNLINEVLESRSNRTLPLEVRQIVKEETVEIAFYPSQTIALASYQLAFDLDEKEVAFQNVIGGTTLPISNVTADSQLLLSWFTPNGEDVALNTAQPIFSLQFDKQELDFSQIALAEQRLEAIGFTTNLDKWKIQLIASEPEPTVFKVYQNTPNPFRQHTVIRFDLPQATPVQLHISNSLGQLVHQQQATYEAGQHQIAVADLNLPKGWYLYTVATNKYQATKKMLIIE